MQLLRNACVACLILLAVTIEFAQPTCVLESDFGFKINCAFKKSGLFRVRNLGGLKAHASIGFSLGDELGFEQSLTNLDPSRRRSVSVNNGAPPYLVTDAGKQAGKQEKRGKQNRIMMRPPAPPGRPSQSAMDKLTSLHRRASSTMRPIIVPGPTVEAPTKLTRVNPTVTMAKPLPMGVPPFKPLPPKNENMSVLPIAVTKVYTPLQVPQAKAGVAYPSENYPHISHDQVSKMVSQMTATHMAQPLYRITPTPIIVNTPKLYSIPTTLNPFIPMPIAAPPTRAAMTIIPAPVLNHSIKVVPFSKAPTFSFNQNTQTFHQTNPISNFVDPAPQQIQDLASYPVYNTKKVDDYNSITGYGDDVTLKFNKEDINAKIVEIAKAGNISMDAVEAAIALRQQQLLNKYANIPLPTTTSTSTTTTTTTTEAPIVFQSEPEPEPEIVVPEVKQKPARFPTSGKVMNAPKEYYPIGYEKNFDDHFQSKVDLPDTTFHCGDQKYFPGLYGDESLGCMVFHVCALTDDGLVMKSFLCPESTLFDQTILKCNWWFYVDCPSTRRLYDTNIPVSKSYQLMKALTFFSSYKKEMQDENSHSTNPEDVEGVKEAITILENQNQNQNAQVEVGSAPNAIHIITPQPFVDERSNHRTNNETAPVYRGTRNYKPSNNTNGSRINKPRPPINRQSNEQTSSEFRLVTVNADINVNRNDTSAENFKTTSSESTERKYKRKMSLRRTSSTTAKPITSPTIITTTTIKPLRNTPSIEIVKQEIKTVEELNTTGVKQEKLSDEVENLDKIDSTILKDAENSPPVKRFYRSSIERTSAEKINTEMAMVNNEKVQIVRPTSVARLVGEYPTQSATIQKLDEAILGKSNRRMKKETVTVVTPEKHFRSKERT
ncbi:uncharacterized protein LOC134745685 isoform X1 [Cydia strobilella]|uniref:uncharacterized protein LOC134745685 isoform X1 n=1 Tax=Cydia strobilella TaxID=1100964 RepID=UPI0030060180